MKRRLICLCLLVFLLPLTAAGAGNGGSLRVVLQHAGVPVSGGVLTLYCVGGSGENGFCLKPQFMKSGVDLNTDRWEEAAETLASFAENMSIVGRSKPVGSDGTVVFDDLEDGLYLLVQAAPAPGYRPFRPFLLDIPQEINGTKLYHIDAAPKLHPEGPGDPELPQTGQLKWPVPILLILGGGLMALGIAGRRRNEEQ